MNTSRERDSCVTPKLIEDLHDYVSFHRMNVFFGAICFSLNIVLFSVFLSSPTLRKKHRNRILMILGLADTFNTLAILFMGKNRVELYTEVIQTHNLPTRTAWQCAIEPWLILRGIGDIWPPVVQMVIGIQRALAVFAPIWFHKNGRNRSSFLFGSTLVILLPTLLIGFVIAYINRNMKVLYYCGRKAAFGKNYAIFIYIINIFGYLFSFLINCITMIKASSTINKLVRRQIINVRYSLVISFISFILVSIPNMISILSVHYEEVLSFISKPSTYFTCINSGINIFVYLSLNAEFRHQFKYLFCNKKRVVTYGEAEKASKGSKTRHHVDLVVHSVHSLA
uniref:G_PROTEIN_RECEP_F1_2 domain-containing protein n=2 Tax=Caenorhabditis tropicalis TaxID=1561998 RepID=A0A1I7ULN2_9PELO